MLEDLTPSLFRFWYSLSLWYLKQKYTNANHSNILQRITLLCFIVVTFKLHASANSHQPKCGLRGLRTEMWSARDNVKSCLQRKGQKLLINDWYSWLYQKLKKLFLKLYNSCKFIIHKKKIKTKILNNAYEDRLDMWQRNEIYAEECKFIFIDNTISLK